MAGKFMASLRGSQQIDITVTGRVSGRPITAPVWFAQENGMLHLLPVTGSDSNWFKNVRANPSMRLSAGGESIAVMATPITDPDRTRAVVEEFREKYGAEQVAAYYPKTDVAVEISLPDQTA
jgi:deazaflavin-dependent oxidoreductase (nitroreductase family)